MKCKNIDCVFAEICEAYKIKKGILSKWRTGISGNACEHYKHDGTDDEYLPSKKSVIVDRLVDLSLLPYNVIFTDTNFLIIQHS